MADQQRLIETLRSTSAALLALRKSITASGHLDAMVAIDTLLAVAQAETNRHIAVASRVIKGMISVTATAAGDFPRRKEGIQRDRRRHGP